MHGAKYADATVGAAARLVVNGDIHVLAERRKQPHQTIARDVRETTVQEYRYLCLIDPHERGGHAGA
jgi:hypothetical protein